MLGAVLDQLEQSDLPAPMFRTAMRLARRTAAGSSYVRVTYEEMAEIVGTSSDHTVRGHLAGLSRAGLFTYQRNHAVHIWWKVIAERAPRASDDQVPIEYRQQVIVERAPRASDDQLPGEDGEPVIAERAPRAPHDQPLREDEKFDRGTRATRDERAPRASDDHPIGRLGRKVGRLIDDPTYLPEGGDGGKQPADEAEAQRSFELLTDREIGLDPATATVLAQRHSFEEIRAQGFRFLRDRAAGAVRSPAVITSRLQKRWAAGPVLADDKRSDLWRRHCWDENVDPVSGDNLRRKYIPDEFEGIILG